MYICIKDQIQNMNLVIGCTVGCTYCYARNNVKRYHIINDFNKPEFFPNKLRLMEKERPQNFLLTGMSDLAGWEQEWIAQVFGKIAENPQHQFLFLTKRPDLLNIDTDLENAWFGVTVTRKSELWRIDTLKNNVRARHYHVTFEPLFDDPGDVEHTKRNKGQPIIRQMALFPYTIINSLVMRILETTKEEILWSSVLLVICSINGNLPNRFIYLF